MRMLVVGGSRGTGAEAVKAALTRGHEVTAFSRKPDQLNIEHPRLNRRRGDLASPESVAEAVRGHEAVLLTASPSLFAYKHQPNFLFTGTGLLIEAMKASGSRRLVVLSSLGTGDSKPLVRSWVHRLLNASGLIDVYHADHERQEPLVRESGLEWVIARAALLTNGPARRRYVKEPRIAPVPGWISRADVADFMVEAAEVDTWVGQAVHLGGR